MPSVDFRGYVDLTLFDKTDQDIYEEAIQNLAVFMPEWVPREGNVEVLLLEALALEVAQGMYAINRLPDSITEVLLQMFGVFRDNGLQPIVNLEFDMVDNTGYTVPAGTSVVLTIVDGIDPVVFSTDIDLVIPPGSTTGTVTATGDRFTQDANGVVANAQVSMLNGMSQINSCIILSLNTAGRDAEDDATYLDRASQRLAQLTQALVLASQYQAAALEQPGIERALAIDNYNPNSGHAPGVDGGYLTVAVYGENVLVDADTKADLASGLNLRSQANMFVYVIDATVITQNVVCTVVADQGADPATVQASVQATLADYLSTANWNWDGVIRFNSLIQVIGSAEGVAYVQSLTTPNADVDHSSVVAPLMQLGTATVTVVTP